MKDGSLIKAAALVGSCRIVYHQLFTDRNKRMFNRGGFAPAWVKGG